MRPASIQTFEKFFLASLAIGLVNAALSYNDNMKMLAADPATAEMASATSFMLPVLVFSVGIPLLLWFLIARKASNVAKWVLVVLTALGLLMMIPTLVTLAGINMVSTVLTVAVNALQIYAIVQLFKPDAKAWLEGKAG